MAASNNFMQGEWDWMKNDPYLKQIEAEQERQDANRWNKMMQMLPMMNRMTDEQMLGYGLGRLLRDGLLSWKKNYEERGERKANKGDDPSKWGAGDADKIGGFYRGFQRLEPRPEDAPRPWNVLSKPQSDVPTKDLLDINGMLKMPNGQMVNIAPQGAAPVAVTETGLLATPGEYAPGEGGLKLDDVRAFW